MVTLRQLQRKPRERKKAKLKKLALKYNYNLKKKKRYLSRNPYVKGIVKKMLILNPKKPNSGKRKGAIISLSNQIQVIAYIPGEGHNIQEFSSVLICGGGAQDLPGVKYHVVRGKLDAKGVDGRKQGRSLYGTKKAK